MGRQWFYQRKKKTANSPEMRITGYGLKALLEDAILFSLEIL
jgi:hypothetical protein